MNRDVFEGLTPAQQKIVEIACGECHQWNLTQFHSHNGQALAQLRSGGVQTFEFPDSVWDAFGAATNEVMQENMSDDLFARIYDSYTASMQSTAAWIAVTEGPFTAQRARVMG
jgi:TRAP-type mannitol/chloroaromatic compound transport system substrate-binding protein